MAFGTKTNEREGTRAVLSDHRTSAFKIRPVLDLIRNKPVGEAREILQFCERDAADLIIKLVDSAVANAEHNDGLDGSELFVSACYADEGRTFKTFKPRARGRAGKIRKRSAHITVIVSQLPEERLSIVKAKVERNEANRRARRVAGSQGRTGRGAANKPVADEVVVPTTDEIIEAGIVDQNLPAAEETATVDGDTHVDQVPPDVDGATGDIIEAGIVDQDIAATEAVDEQSTNEDDK